MKNLINQNRFLLITIFALISSVGQSKAQSYFVKLKVKNQQNSEILSGAKVLLLSVANKEKQIAQTTQSDNTGVASFQIKQNGEYEFQVIADGYEKKTLPFKFKIDQDTYFNTTVNLNPNKK